MLFWNPSPPDSFGPQQCMTLCVGASSIQHVVVERGYVHISLCGNRPGGAKRPRAFHRHRVYAKSAVPTVRCDDSIRA